MDLIWIGLALALGLGLGMVIGADWQDRRTPARSLAQDLRALRRDALQ